MIYNFVSQTIKLDYRYFIKLSFLGTKFHGWQSQKNAGSVQSILDEALTVILKSKIRITGAGRTDAGVHAKEYYAHFEIGYPLNDETCKKLIISLNGYLPKDIAIQRIIPVRPDAHARFSAISRTYLYILAREKDPFLEGLAYFYPYDLDIPKMNKGAGKLVRTKDFSSFVKSPSDARTNICRVTEAQWEEEENRLIFTITADRFLRNMVRAITGTLIDLGRNKISLKDLETIIKSRNRSAAGYSVPACGLYLVSIKYPEDIYLEDPHDL